MRANVNTFVARIHCYARTRTYTCTRTETHWLSHETVKDRRQQQANEQQLKTAEDETDGLLIGRHYDATPLVLQFGEELQTELLHVARYCFLPHVDVRQRTALWVDGRHVG